MGLSRTQRALALIKNGNTPSTAADLVGISESTVRIAQGRIKGKVQCPCCNQVVRSGFVISNALAIQERERLAEMLDLFAKQTDNDDIASTFKTMGNHLRSLA